MHLETTRLIITLKAKEPESSFTLYCTNRDYPPVLAGFMAPFPYIKEELRYQNIAYLEGNGNVFQIQRKFAVIDANPPLPAEPKRVVAFTKTD